MRNRLMQAKRIIVKLGTQVVMGADGELDYARLSHLVAQMATLIDEGRHVLLVTSGAVGLGREGLKLGDKKLTLSQKQACAAVGQNLLMNVYRELFADHGLVTAQVLLTAYDFAERERYLNLRETMATLLDLGAVPIINENDTVSTIELAEDKSKSFGDNDKLSALVASKLGADLLVILTSVDGVYTDNPQTNPDAKHIPVVEDFEALKNIGTGGKTTLGRGGMTSRLEAIKIAALSGVNTFIASGFRENSLIDAFNDGQSQGTFVMARAAIPGKKRWLGLVSGYEGVVVVNEGAKKALIENHASLLPIGVVGVQGEFAAEQVVSIQDEQGHEIGRGVAAYAASMIQKIMGKSSKEISAIVGEGSGDEMIHRDDLVIFQDYEP